jgi:hypothetical protein|nr:MAG TPA: hypothetical protein [Bacteriophage sp.]
MKNVCLAIIAMLLMVHLSCEAATAAQGACESCLNGEPTTLQVVIRDLSMGSLSGAAADLGLFDLADVLLHVEEVLDV